MSDKVKVVVNGRSLVAEAGTLLSEILGAEKPCGGHGRCGKCKVMARGAVSSPSAEELKLLSKEELSKGVRLSCRARAMGDCEITISEASGEERIVTDGVLPSFNLAPTFKRFGVAIDVGTTTVVARLYNTDGDLLGEASCLNSQREWGADVISRIEAALNGKAEELARAIRTTLDSVIKELSYIAKIDSMDIDRVVITGNTVMLSLIAGESVEPFSHAPFKAERLFGEVLLAGDIELSSLKSDTGVYFPPCISAFVGADTVCAMLSTEFCKKDPVMLVDIGTNGEIALWSDNRLSFCSTAAGPAFEGVGISMGMRGSKGAIDKVSIINQRLCAHVLGGGSPKGICGSGLIDAVACMLDLEMLDESGYFEEDRLAVDGAVFLSQSDIRMVQLAKSAICAGILTLMENEKLKASSIQTLYIAGGFGSYLNKKSAARIGLIPKELSAKSQAVGNAALSGAAVLLLNSEKRKEAESVAKKAITVELATSPVFSEKYMTSMRLEEI